MLLVPTDVSPCPLEFALFESQSELQKIKKLHIKEKKKSHNMYIFKPRYNKQVSQTLFVHYTEYFTISNVISLVNPQIGSWVLFSISRISLYQGSLFRGIYLRVINQDALLYLKTRQKGVNFR